MSEIKRWLMMITILYLIMASSAIAKEIGGVSVPDTLTAGNERLVLNGAGLRKKFIVKVYAGALYLLQKSNDSTKIISADEPMAVRMHFIHDSVSADKLIAAWNEGFAKSDTSAIKAQVDRFNSFFKQDAGKGDIYDFVYLPGKGVSVSINAKIVGTVEGLGFKRALFGIWLADPPADKDLKAGMLGK